MRITLSYQLDDGGAPRRMELDPAEYLDPLEAGESAWEDGVERHLLLHEYVGVEPAQVRWVVAEVTDAGRTRIRRAQYLDGDSVLMEHSIDEDRGEEIVLSTRLPGGEWHTIRVAKPGDATWAVTVNNLTPDAPEGDASPIHDMCPNWTFAEREGFSRVGIPC